MRIVLIGDVGPAPYYHVGDEAMLEAAAAQLRARIPGVELTVISAAPADSASRYGATSLGRLGFASVRDSRDDLDDRLERVLAAAAGRSAGLAPTDPAWEVIESVSESDGVLISGGGNLTTPFVEHVYERAALAGIAEIRGVPVVVTSQSLGPRLDPRDRELVRSLLRSARLVGIRESESHALADELAGSARLVPDDAVSLVGASDVELTAGLGVKPGAFVAMSFPPYAGLDALDDFVADIGVLVESVRQTTGLPVVLIPHEGELGSASAGDGAVHDRLAGDGVIAAPVFPAATVAVLTASAALVVSARYHPLVFAAAGRVPAVGVWLDEYTRRKVRGVLATAGLASWAIPAAGVGSGLVAEVVAEAWSRRDEITAHLATAAAAQTATGDAWWAEVASAFGAAKPRRAPAIGQKISPLSLSPHLTGRVAALDRWSRAAFAAVEAERLRGEELAAELAAERRLADIAPDLKFEFEQILPLADGAVGRVVPLAEHDALQQALWERDRFATATARQVIELRHRLDEAAASSDARIAALTRSFSWRLGLPLRILRRPRHYAREMFRR